MSRSFHITKKEIKDFRSKMSLADNDHIEAYEKLCEQYSKKRRTKEHIQSERKRNLNIPVQTQIDSIPAEFIYDSQYIHYPVTDKDIRNLLKTMPQGLVDGLSKIVFCSGTHLQEVPPKDEMYSEPQRDPYIGRIGYEVFEDVYQGRCLGAYFCHQKVIRIFGYVYPDNIKHREIVDFFLCIQTLLVFLHELAHHYDFEQRTARVRWRHDNTETVEIYAEQRAHQWINDYAIPCICKTYANEYDYLRKWMKQHIGIILPIALLAGDYRATGKKGMFRMGSFFNTSEYFARFASRIQQQNNIMSARVKLADQLHVAEEYAAALKILKLVLKEDAKDIDALCLCGDIHCHLKNFPRAIQYAQKAFLLHKNEIDVYRVLCDAYQGLQNWTAVIKWAGNGLDFAETKGEALFLLRSKANAEMELNELEEAKHTISEIKEFYNGLMIKPLEDKLKQKQRKK